MEPRSIPVGDHAAPATIARLRAHKVEKYRFVSLLRQSGANSRGVSLAALRAGSLLFSSRLSVNKLAAKTS